MTPIPNHAPLMADASRQPPGLFCDVCQLPVKYEELSSHQHSQPTTPTGRSCDHWFMHDGRCYYCGRSRT